MAKRRISLAVESSDDDYCASDSGSLHSKTIKSKRKSAKKKPRTVESDGGLEDLDGAKDATQSYPHKASTHEISSPRPLRVALLKWYARVHQTRGMPWRKQYDPALGLNERAQRAYEVRIFTGLLFVPCAYLLKCLIRFGYPK